MFDDPSGAGVAAFPLASPGRCHINLDRRGAGFGRPADLRPPASTPCSSVLTKSAMRCGRFSAKANSAPSRLVARFSQIEGYRCLSLIRAFGVVKCQLALA
jgi:hypothetical protein